VQSKLPIDNTRVSSPAKPHWCGPL
jgi:hypothetical protein